MGHNISYYTDLLNNGNIAAFLATIRKFESSNNYNARYHPDHSAFFNSPPWEHPNLPELIKKGTQAGKHSTAAGAYQFTYPTWTDTLKKLPLSDFSPINQDKAALTLMSDEVIGYIKSGQITLALQKLSGRWASMPFSTAKQSDYKVSAWYDVYKSFGGLIDTENLNIASSNINLASDSEMIMTADGKFAPATQLNFDRIAQNINSQELDNTEVSWGNRSTSLEESDYIGLKQYIIYLITRYYPQSLIPFVELIPNFKVDSPNEERKLAADIAAATGVIYGKDVENMLNNRNLESDDKLIDENRYNRTSEKLAKLNSSGGTDMFTNDPFEEFSSSFNSPNENGINYSKKRGFSYKIYGNLVLNPSSDANDLSKPGAIGLTGITIENGSQVQNGMTLITVKIKDVQGNKLLDINSPWSFLLNQVPGKVGGEFFFRYGWQIKIPKFDYNNNYTLDPTAGKFWNHVGWANIFFARSGENNDNLDKGSKIKKYLWGLAEKADSTLTFTQSIDKNSLMNPGYEKTLEENGRTAYRIKRDINLFNYLPLTLIQPDISVNPKDGSIDATLVFRTNSATANCLCPLNGIGVIDFKTRALVSSSSTVTLTELMSAFVEDNKNYAILNPALQELSNSNNKTSSIFYHDNTKEKGINSWLTVIGGVGDDSQLNINPDNIKVTISTDFKDKIINATSKDTTSLLEWLNKVLYENDMAILVAADKSTGAQLQEGFIIAYDSKKAESADGEIKSNDDLSSIDMTFGNYLRYINGDDSDKYFIGNRLYTQDDVFSFRFQGSLVEDISIEKLNAPNAASQAALLNHAAEQGENDGADSHDVTKKNPNNKTVSITDKKRNLNTLYSTMLGLKVTAICHPWLKIARPCFIKGMGFWDGKYTITKISHELSNTGKFISVINGTRIQDKNLIENAKDKYFRQTGIAMNNPGAYKAEFYNGQIPRGTAVKSTAPANSIPSGIFDGINNNPTDFSQPFLTNNKAPLLRNDLEKYIENLHDDYKNHFRSFINDFETNNSYGYKVLITSGYRPFFEQKILKEEDNRNASPGHSSHNYGLAIDINITLNGNVIARKNSSDFTWYDTGILTFSKKYGFTWGGDSFGDYKDRVHFGLDKTFNTDILLIQCLRQFGNDPDKIIGNKVSFRG